VEPFLVGPLLTSTVSLSAALPALRPPEVLGGRDLVGLACLLASLPLGLAALAAFAMLCAISWPTLCEYAALALGLLGVTYFYGLKASAAAAGASYLAASAFDIALHAYKCGCLAPLERPEPLSAAPAALQSMLPTLGAYELLAILAILLLLFGSRKIPELARALGQSIREFRRAQREDLSDEAGEKRGA